MNKTSIEWCDYTWNPITGCFHSCRNIYCYNTMKATSPLNRFGVRYKDENGNFKYEKNWRKRQKEQCHIAQKGEIYPYGYDPTFYPHRLEEPLRVKKPSKIFVVDTGDMFGNWIPEEWIEQILEVVRKCDWHTFQFLTKNPERLSKYKFPDNSWVGTSVNSDRDKEKADTIKKAKARIKFLSIEPLLGPITFDLRGIDWIIIGAQTGRNPVIPDRRWLENIMIKANKNSIPIFVKNNIKIFSKYAIQEFPIFI
ncbi:MULTISPECIES: DUF5131 family protein [Thermodesulfovibrio]|uniref:DUF5131 family protein n=1 Tax=Thermodesulfovibrio TaxID=28261 RepID=UPI00262D3548|nr:DUF5131 family protein [Thermodesulfovibrio sp.]